MAQDVNQHWLSFVVSALRGVWGVCVFSNQCCRRDRAAPEHPGHLRTGRARHPPSVCFLPSPATVSYASETSHFGSSSPTLHHTPLQNTHKHVYLFAWDVLLHFNLNYTTQLCKFIHFKLSKQHCHSVSQCQLYLNSPQEISSEWEGPKHCHAWQSTIYRYADF